MTEEELMERELLFQLTGEELYDTIEIDEEEIEEYVENEKPVYVSEDGRAWKGAGRILGDLRGDRAFAISGREDCQAPEEGKTKSNDEGRSSSKEESEEEVDFLEKWKRKFILFSLFSIQIIVIANYFLART